MSTLEQIMTLLKISKNTAFEVLEEMENSGLDFSECTQADFNQCARESYETVENGTDYGYGDQKNFD